MGLWDVVKSYVDRISQGWNNEETPVEDFGGGISDLDDLSFSGLDDRDDFSGIHEVWDIYDAIEEELGDRIIDDIRQTEGGEFVTQFFDAGTTNEYLRTTPETILRVYVEWMDDGTQEYHVYRFPSG